MFPTILLAYPFRGRHNVCIALHSTTVYIILRTRKRTDYHHIHIIWMATHHSMLTTAHQGNTKNRTNTRYYCCSTMENVYLYQSQTPDACVHVPHLLLKVWKKTVYSGIHPPNEAPPPTIAESSAFTGTHPNSVYGARLETSYQEKYLVSYIPGI